MSHAKPQAHPWFQAVLDQKRESYAVINFMSPEYFSWKDYFVKLEWVPATFLECSLQKPWTSPCHWPSELHLQMPDNYPRLGYRQLREFDRTPSFSAGRQQEVADRMDKLIEELRGKTKQATRPSRFASGPSSEELRRIYAPREEVAE
jgi:hypothetical protein